MVRVVPALLAIGTVGCTSSGLAHVEPSDPTAPPPTQANTSSPTSGSGSSTASVTDTAGGTPTGYASTHLVGSATISPSNGYLGTETLLATRNGQDLCRYTWQTRDWRNVVGTPSPLEVPCRDAAGAPCTWSFAVVVSEGVEESGDCAPFAPAESTLVGHGYIQDYLGAGATSYGEQFMYYLNDGTGSPGWTRMPVPFTFDETTGGLTYDIDLGILAY